MAEAASELPASTERVAEETEEVRSLVPKENAAPTLEGTDLTLVSVVAVAAAGGGVATLQAAAVVS